MPIEKEKWDELLMKDKWERKKKCKRKYVNICMQS